MKLEINKQKLKNLVQNLLKHPIFASLVVIVIVASGGTFRLNQVIDQNHRNVMEECEQRNAAWNRIIDLVEPRFDNPNIIPDLRDVGIVDCDDP